MQRTFIFEAAMRKLLFAGIMLALTSCNTIKPLYRNEVAQRMDQEMISDKLLAPSDVNRLPETVATYVERCGWIGKPVPQNFYASYSGYFSLKKGKYQKITAEQYSFLTPEESRFYLISNQLFTGRHRLDHRGSFMLIKLFGLFKVAGANGKEMEQSELVTYFNDLCLLAPGALPFAPVIWEPIDPLTVKGTISAFGRTATATLHFDQAGDLIDFRSNDRYATANGKNPQKFPWSTPVHDYRERNGLRHPTRAEAIWHMPDGDFEYARFVIDSIQFNLAETHFPHPQSTKAYKLKTEIENILP